MAQTAVIVDANEERAEQFDRHLTQQLSMHTQKLSSLEELLYQILAEQSALPDLVLCAIDAASGKTIETLRALYNSIQIIALVNYNTIEKGMEAVSAGADNFLVMPFHPTQLTVAIRNTLAYRNIHHEIRHKFSDLSLSLNELPTESAAMQATVFLAQGLAASNSPIILEGAPGTGHEFWAQAIHGSSDRRQKPFLTFNAAFYSAKQIPEVLFGKKNEPGLLERTAGGTLFVRNIDKVKEDILEKLIDIVANNQPITLEGKELRRFQGHVMFAEHDAPRRHTEHEKSRISDFYSHLNALPISLPYLKDMKEDLPYLALVYCRHFAAMEGKTVFGVTPDSVEMLQEAAWPGNLDQLASTIFDAIMCCRTHELKPEDFRHMVQSGKQYRINKIVGPDFHANAISMDGLLNCTDQDGNIRKLQDVEQDLIRFALDRYSGHMSEVARYLGIGRSTLYRKLSSMEES